MKTMKAIINDWLDVGACESCPDDGYELVIHIYRHDTGEKQERHCKHPDNRINIKLDYKDGHEFNVHHLDKLTEAVGLLRERKRKTLVHCHAGMCRSPTVAIYLLAFVDGMEPHQARDLITQAIYKQRQRLVCNVVYEPFKQIVRLWEMVSSWHRGTA